MGASGIPGLSALLVWPTDHLTEAAAHWDRVSEQTYAVAHQLWRDATSIDWSGQAADALRPATQADLQTASAAVDQLQEAARVARSGASDLYAARSLVRYAVADAQTADLKWARTFRSVTAGPADQLPSGWPGKPKPRPSPGVSVSAPPNWWAWMLKSPVE